MAKIKILVSYIDDLMCGFWTIKMAPWGSQAKQICPWVAKIYPLLMNVMPFTGGYNFANLKPKPRGLTTI